MCGRKGDTDTHTHTHKHTHTHTHTKPHKQSLPTISDHHTAVVHKTMLQLCNSIECRQTARRGGSAKVEIQAVHLGKWQTV